MATTSAASQPHTPWIVSGTAAGEGSPSAGSGNVAGTGERHCLPADPGTSRGDAPFVIRNCTRPSTLPVRLATDARVRRG